MFAIEQQVMTPRGKGYVWQIFQDRIAVVLDRASDKVMFFKPGEVQEINRP